MEDTFPAGWSFTATIGNETLPLKATDSTGFDASFPKATVTLPAQAHVELQRPGRPSTTFDSNLWSLEAPSVASPTAKLGTTIDVELGTTIDVGVAPIASPPPWDQRNSVFGSDYPQRGTVSVQLDSTCFDATSDGTDAMFQDPSGFANGKSVKLTVPTAYAADLPASASCTGGRVPLDLQLDLMTVRGYTDGTVFVGQSRVSSSPPTGNAAPTAPTSGGPVVR